MKVEFEKEEDGRWIAEIPKLPGVMAYGFTKREAQQKVFAIALRTLADFVDEGKVPVSIRKLFSYGVVSK